VWWYLRTFSGETRWDDYLAACEREGVPPTTRREFERHRADRVEHAPMARCC
jgi:uncharacterized short protein YbdD (DUF466 family)